MVGVDLGSGRAFSAAVAVFGNGRIEALALAPGIPSHLRLKRTGIELVGVSMENLLDSGKLAIAEGLRVQPPAMLWAMILENSGGDHNTLSSTGSENPTFRMPSMGLYLFRLG